MGGGGVGQEQIGACGSFHLFQVRKDHPPTMSRRRQAILMIADTARPVDWKLHLRVTSSRQVAGTLRPGASCVGEGQGEAGGWGQSVPLSS